MSTALDADALVVTFTDDTHEEKCTFVEGWGETSQPCELAALWRLIVRRVCDCGLEEFGCQPHRYAVERGINGWGMGAECSACNAPYGLIGWEPVGSR